MTIAPLPDNEPARIEAVRRYNILDTAPEKAFDDLALLAAHICQAPIALIGVIDVHRQWFKSKVGLTASETPRDVSFCAHAILGPELFIVQDALADDRFADNPLVASPPNIRFYAGAPLVTPDGYAVGTLSVMDHVARDLSPEQAQALQALGRQAASQLELRHKTVQLERELTRAQKLEAIGLLAGGLAHDFNNILTAILGNLSLVKMLAESEKLVVERLTEAENAATRAKDLTQQLLTFAKGGVPVKKTVSVPELIKESTGFALSGSSARCLLAVPDDLWPVEADEGQMSQVIHNLLINAGQSMPHGGIVHVRAENVTVGANHGLPVKSGKYIQIDIQDQGSGILPQHLPRIFEPYFTTKEKGNGLGLTTAASIVKRHDGHIAVQTQVGMGSTFTVYLPASDKPLAPKKKVDAEVVIGRGRVLVMDDEDIIQDVAGKMLTRLGYDVAFARDGAEAIAAFQQARAAGQPFDVVIVDLTIPGGMGGKDTIRKLRSIDPRIKAIVSSGYSNDPVMANFREYGFTDVMAKPYKLQDVSQVLHRVLNEPRSPEGGH
jgi:signal transduction histidine kinase/ActR/RegA family two-component response regulator